MARVIVIRNDYHDYERPKLVSPTSPTSPTRRFQYATTRKNSNSRFNPDENDVELPSILACRLQNLGSYKRKQIIPEFTSRLDDQWHHHDDTIILKIGFKGFPAPNVTWYKDHDQILSTMRTMIYTSESCSELVIYDAKKSDSGFYTCRIENPLGVRDTNCQIYIGDNGIVKSKGLKSLTANHRLYKSVLYAPALKYPMF